MIRKGTRAGLLSNQRASAKTAAAEPPPKASTSAAAILLPRQPLPRNASITALQFIAGRFSGIHEAVGSAECGLPFKRYATARCGKPFRTTVSGGTSG